MHYEPETLPLFPAGILPDIAAHEAGVPDRESIFMTQALRAIHHCQAGRDPGPALDDMLIEMHRSMIDDPDSDQALLLQGRTLELLFGRLLMLALPPPGAVTETGAETGAETGTVNTYLLDLALRTQKQCVSTIFLRAGLARTRRRDERDEQNEGAERW
jgi:hypothetical protein